MCCIVLPAVHTMAELKLSGNHLKGSRPVLSFDARFDELPHLQLLKEMLTQAREMRATQGSLYDLGTPGVSCCQCPAHAHHLLALDGLAFRCSPRPSGTTRASPFLTTSSPSPSLVRLLSCSPACHLQGVLASQKCFSAHMQLFATFPCQMTASGCATTRYWKTRTRRRQGQRG